MFLLQQKSISSKLQSWIYDLGKDPSSHERKNQLNVSKKNIRVNEVNNEARLALLVDNRKQDRVLAHKEIDYLKEQTNAMDEELKSLKEGNIAMDTKGATFRGSFVNHSAEGNPSSRKLSRFLPMTRRESIQSPTTSLDNDTFALMMILDVFSPSWLLGSMSFFFTLTLQIMIMTEQFKQSVDSCIFNIPFKVSNPVRVGQFFAIILTLARNDILTTIQVCHHSFQICFYDHFLFTHCR